MALSKDHSFHGVTLPGAYHRVDGVDWRRANGLKAEALVNLYSSKEAANPPPIKVGEEVVTPEKRDEEDNVVAEAVKKDIMRDQIPQPIPGTGLRLTFDYDPKGGDIRAQAYAALKKHLGGGKDC